jgi:NDP-sugar pyrophosphorylase family protein
MNKTGTTAMILAAGMGTRLGSITQQKPKALVDINGKTLLMRVIEKLSESGFKNIVVNVHHFSEQVINMLQQSNLEDVNITISNEQHTLLDTGGGIIKAMPYFDPATAVLVHNVDIISDVDLRQFVDDFSDSGDDAWLATQRRESHRKLLFDEQNLLTGWTNNKTGEFKWTHPGKDYSKALSFSGIHCFRPSLFMDTQVRKCSIIDLYLEAARHHRIVSQQLPYSYWFDLGKPEQLISASNYLKDLKKT